LVGSTDNWIAADDVDHSTITGFESSGIVAWNRRIMMDELEGDHDVGSMAARCACLHNLSFERLIDLTVE
jgi:hypothetical protein